MKLEHTAGSNRVRENRSSRRRHAILNFVNIDSKSIGIIITKHKKNTSTFCIYNNNV